MEPHRGHWCGGLAHAAQALPAVSKSNSPIDRAEVFALAQVQAGDSVFLIGAAKHSAAAYAAELGKLIDSRCLCSGAGPIAIVLVVNRQRMLEMHEQCISHGLNGDKIVLICSSEDTESARTKLLDGCDLLLGTATQINEVLLQYEPQLFAATRLQSIVLDELELLRETLIDALLQRPDQAVDNVQLVVTGRLWQKSKMDKLLKHAKRPLLLFKDMLEAVAYAELKFIVALGENPQQQLQQLREFLGKYPASTYRTLIYCASTAQLAMLMQELEPDSYLLHRGRQDTARIAKWQQQTKGKILLLSAHAPELQLISVQSLIHFNMPQAWSQFKQRFAVCSAEIPNLLMGAEHKQLQTLLLLDAVSKQMLPHLLEFMQQHGLSIPDALMRAHKQLQAKQESDLVARQCVLCPVLLLYGHCQTPTCRYRHVLAEGIDYVDGNEESAVPETGSIQFELLKICTPTHYAVRLLAHRRTASIAWQTLPHAARYDELQQCLKTHYATAAHCMPPTSVQLQQIFVRRIAAAAGYERVCITYVRDTTLRVKHLDSNTAIYHAKLTELLVCPPALQQWPPLAADVRLAGIVPYNDEQSWQCTATQSAVSDLLSTMRIYTANVQFALKHTIFVSDLQLKEDAEDLLQQLQRRGLGKFEKSVCTRLKQLATK